MQNESVDWRTFLKYIIQDREVLGKLSHEIHVNPLTLIRWTTTTKKSITPHRAHLEQLVAAEAFPEHARSHMIALLQQEFQDFCPLPMLAQDNHAYEAIPHEFYHRVVRAYSLTEENLSFATIVQLVTQQIVGHLSTKNDTLRTGIFLLTRPAQMGNPVRSLHMPILPSGMRLTSLPKMFPIFAGVESFLSFALRSPTCPLVFSVEEMPMPSLPELTNIQNTLVIPLQRKGKLGGCFVVSSEKNNFFAHQNYEEIACSYGFLLSLALEDQDFYEPSQIALCVFPPLQKQLEQEKAFPFSERMTRTQTRVIHQLLVDQNSPVHGMLSLKQVERNALQELEWELMEKPLTSLRKDEKEAQHGR